MEAQIIIMDKFEMPFRGGTAVPDESNREFNMLSTDEELTAESYEQEELALRWECYQDELRDAVLKVADFQTWKNKHAKEEYERLMGYHGINDANFDGAFPYTELDQTFKAQFQKEYDAYVELMTI